MHENRINITAEDNNFKMNFWENIRSSLELENCSLCDRLVLRELCTRKKWIDTIPRGLQESYSHLYQCIRGLGSADSEVIERDVLRTVGAVKDGLKIFRHTNGDTSTEGTGLSKANSARAMHRLLTALSITDGMGYCQGMNYVVDFLLKTVSEEDAFCLFLFVLRNKHLCSMYETQLPVLSDFMEVFELELTHLRPVLASTLKARGFFPQFYSIEWFTTIFTLACPSQLTLAIWDLFFFGFKDTFLRCALSFMECLELDLLTMSTEELLKGFRQAAMAVDPVEVILRAFSVELVSVHLSSTDVFQKQQYTLDLTKYQDVQGVDAMLLLRHRYLQGSSELFHVDADDDHDSMAPSNNRRSESIGSIKSPVVKPEEDGNKMAKLISSYSFPQVTVGGETTSNPAFSPDGMSFDLLSRVIEMHAIITTCDRINHWAELNQCWFDCLSLLSSELLRSNLADYLLRYAIASKAHIRVVSFLLSVGGADPNSQDKLLRTPLHYAAVHGRCDCIRLLIIAGADTSIPGALCSLDDVPLMTTPYDLLAAHNGNYSSKVISTAMILLRRKCCIYCNCLFSSFESGKDKQFRCKHCDITLCITCSKVHLCVWNTKRSRVIFQSLLGLKKAGMEATPVSKDIANATVISPTPMISASKVTSTTKRFSESDHEFSDFSTKIIWDGDDIKVFNNDNNNNNNNNDNNSNNNNFFHDFSDFGNTDNFELKSFRSKKSKDSIENKSTNNSCTSSDPLSSPDPNPTKTDHCHVSISSPVEDIVAQIHFSAEKEALSDRRTLISVASMESISSLVDNPYVTEHNVIDTIRDSDTNGRAIIFRPFDSDDESINDEINTAYNNTTKKNNNNITNNVRNSIHNYSASSLGDETHNMNILLNSNEAPKEDIGHKDDDENNRSTSVWARWGKGIFRRSVSPANDTNPLNNDNGNEHGDVIMNNISTINNGGSVRGRSRSISKIDESSSSVDHKKDPSNVIPTTLNTNSTATTTRQRLSISFKQQFSKFTKKIDAVISQTKGTRSPSPEDLEVAPSVDYVQDEEDIRVDENGIPLYWVGYNESQDNDVSHLAPWQLLLLPMVLWSDDMYVKMLSSSDYIDFFGDQSICRQQLLESFNIYGGKALIWSDMYNFGCQPSKLHFSNEMFTSYAMLQKDFNAFYCGNGNVFEQSKTSILDDIRSQQVRELQSSGHFSSNSLGDLYTMSSFLNGHRALKEGDFLWTPDDQVWCCQKCDVQFSLFYRKHHCRRCGGVFCGDDARSYDTVECLPDNLKMLRLCSSCKDEVKSSFHLCMSLSQQINNCTLTFWHFILFNRSYRNSKSRAMSGNDLQNNSDNSQSPIELKDVTFKTFAHPERWIETMNDWIWNG